MVGGFESAPSVWQYAMPLGYRVRLSKQARVWYIFNQRSSKISNASLSFGPHMKTTQGRK